MNIEQQILDSEYDIMYNHLTVRSTLSSFSIEEIESELHHLLIYQGQDWVGRGELKNAEIQGHVYAYQIFIKRYKDSHSL
ncbi:MAG: hypothetical protein EOM67_04150 [Spirochaetia bacterium]|nr:hypothetical protein [Spirochaetia bacterium]